MGLFDFAKNIGTKLFSTEAEAGEKVAAHIEKNNPGVDDLKIDVKDGVATITGNAKDRAAMEKAVLMAGNVEGVESVVAEGLQAPADDQDNVLYYEIASGDNLSAVAKKFLGDANKYHEIFEANREVIQDVDKIYPGQKIRIPGGKA